MIEYDMKRNGSGYYDETPVKAGLFSGPQAGEIWQSTFGKEFLILKNHGGYCTTLALNDNPHPQTIEVVSRTVRHTNPGMVGYSFNNSLKEFIKAIPEEKYMDITQAVGERLGVTIRVSAEDDADEIIREASLDVAAYRAKAEDLEALVEDLKTKCKALEAERDELKTDLECNDGQYHLACNMVKEEKAARETAERVATNMQAAYQQAEEKAAMWEKMYNALLDRLFARGEAK